jgi:Carboxypeptidase regulatory-like domain
MPIYSRSPRRRTVIAAVVFATLTVLAAVSSAQNTAFGHLRSNAIAFSTFVDTTPPVITPYTAPRSPFSSDPVTFTVVATDSDSGLASLVVHYFENGGPEETSVCSLSGVGNCTIPGIYAGSVVTYYVTATDAAGNSSSSPTPYLNLYTVTGDPATVPAGTYASVSLSDMVSLGGAVTVVQNLDLSDSGGEVATGSNVLTLDCLAAISNLSGGEYISGMFRKNLCGATAPTSFTFPVGDVSGNMPVPVTATNITAVGSSSLTVSTTHSKLFPSDPNALNRYWTIVETGDVTANLTFTYAATEEGPNENKYRVYRSNGGSATDLCPSGPCVDHSTFTLTAQVPVTVFGYFTAAAPGGPTGSEVSVSGRVVNAGGNGIQNAVITVSGTGTGVRMSTMTGPFGYFSMGGLDAGDTYVITVQSKRFTFANPNRVVTLNDSVDDILFTANP